MSHFGKPIVNPSLIRTVAQFEAQLIQQFLEGGTLLINKLSGYAITGNSTAAGPSMAVEPLAADPSPNGTTVQEWTISSEPSGTGGNLISFPSGFGSALWCIVVTPSETRDGDPLSATIYEQDEGSFPASWLWYLFADTQQRVAPNGQPYCFLYSAVSYYDVQIPSFDPSDPEYEWANNPYNKVIEVKGASTQPGAEIQAFPLKPAAYRSHDQKPDDSYDNQLWSPGGGAWPLPPMSLPPSTGLYGNSNYVLGNADDGIGLVRSLSIEVVIQEDVVAFDNQGFSFQLNCTSPLGALEVWQQYVFILPPGGDTTLKCSVQNFTPQNLAADSGQPAEDPIVYDFASLCTLPGPVLAAGTTLGIVLTFDPGFLTVIGALFGIVGPNGEFSGSQYIDVSQSPALPSQILAYQFVLVGPWNGRETFFSSGSGSITYGSDLDQISVSCDYGFQYVPVPGSSSEGVSEPQIETGISTGENSNIAYGFLPCSWISPSQTFTQSFGVAQM